MGEDSEADDDAAPNQVIFCSRTHSQLTQVVGELNRTRFGGAEGSVNAVAIAARTQLCVNPEVRATAGGFAARLNERCLELGKPKRPGEGRGSRVGGGCPFLKKRRRAVADLAEAALAVPMDIEDLAAAGTRRKACPYYAARHALPRADLVFAPYASLLHAETRESLVRIPAHDASRRRAFLFFHAFPLVSIFFESSFEPRRTFDQPRRRVNDPGRGGSS